MSRPKGIQQSLKHPRTSGRRVPQQRGTREFNGQHLWQSAPPYDPATSPTLQRLNAALAAIDKRNDKIQP